MSKTSNIFGDDPFDGESFLKSYPDMESTPLLLMTTTPSIEGSSISDYLGMVFGESAIGIGLATSVINTAQSLFGTRAGSTERRMEEVRRQALYHASEHAKSLGGNAVVGVRVDYEVTGGALFVAVTGTAVIAELSPVSASA